MDELEKECLTAIKYIEALKVKDLSTDQKEDILGELSASITHLRIQTEQLDKTFEPTMVGDYMADLVVEGQVILELKTVEDLTSVHQAQLLNYLKATGKPLGLLINFKGKKAMIRRLALDAEC